MPRVHYSRWQPLHLPPTKTTQTAIAVREQIHHAWNVQNLDQRVRDPREILLPMFFHVGFRRFVKRELAPFTGHGIASFCLATLFHPSHIRIGQAVKVGPLCREITYPCYYACFGIGRFVHDERLQGEVVIVDSQGVFEPLCRGLAVHDYDEA